MRNLLTAGGAESGDVLVLIFDSEGQRGESYKLGWDSVTYRSSDEVVTRLSVMNSLSSAHILTASKDVSMAGVIGTATMMLEYSGRGGRLDLDAIDASRPSGVDLEDWIRMYISLGFLVALPKEHLSELEKLVSKHGLTSNVIGVVEDSKKVILKLGEDERTLFDFSKGGVLTPKNTNS